jgi:fimbrial chaperone protein
MRALVLVVGIIAGLGLSAAPAGSIVLAPTTILIGPGDLATSISVRNEMETPASFSVRVFIWRNSETGEMQLEATDDMIVYPEVLNLQPGESRRIRLGTRHPREEPVLLERSYRLLLESLPQPNATPGAGLTVRLRLQFSLPIFLQPQDRAARVSMQPPSINGRRVTLSLSNVGRVHVTPTRIDLTGLGPAGQVVWTKALRPWYVLAGETRQLSVELSLDECRETAGIVAEAGFSEGNQFTVREKRPVSRDAVCGPR